jgi:anaerobic magnesium-protoporphyrin IX monomethyl ester cyclase
MKACLVRPQFNEKQSAVYPPLGLISIAPYLNCEVTIQDSQTDHSEYLAKPCDIYAFSTFTSQLPIVNKSIQTAKASGIKSKFIVGGPGVTSNPDYAMRLAPEADMFFAGDGERFAENIDKLLNSSEKLIDSRNNPASLDNKKMPAWDLIENEQYKQTVGFGIETSRGCPFNCFMCTAHMIHGRRWTARKAVDVVDELVALKDRYGCNRFYFADDNATVDPNRWFDLMSQIADKNLGLTLSVPEGIQAHNLNKETLVTMKKAGLSNFTVGAESGSQRVLDEVINKGGLTLERVEQVVKDAKELGMKASCFFVIGFPGETYDEAKATVAFADKLRHLGAESCSVRNAIPMPGTRMFNVAKAEGFLVVPEERFFDFNFVHEGKHLLKTPEWTPEQIESLVKLAKVQSDKYYLKSNPDAFVKHPRASLRLLSQILKKS